MPFYEIPFILRSAISRTKMKNALKETCGEIFKQGGMIRKIENLGHRPLPHMIRVHKTINNTGHYFCIQMDCSSEGMKEIDNRLRLKTEIIRFGVLRKEEEKRRPCLDGPCLFGELPNPDHDRTAYTRNVLSRYRSKKLSNV